MPTGSAKRRSTSVGWCLRWKDITMATATTAMYVDMRSHDKNAAQENKHTGIFTFRSEFSEKDQSKEKRVRTSLVGAMVARIRVVVIEE